MATIAPGVLEFVDEVKLPPIAKIDARCTVLSVESGGTLLISPIAFSERDVEEIEQLGPPEHIVAPNLFHHFHLVAATERWPDATLWAPPGLSAKCHGLENQIDLDDATHAEHWPEGIGLHAIEGMPKFREFVFFHHASKTLVVTDLLFNHPVGHNAFTRFVFRLTGTYRRCAVSRLFATLIKDEVAFADSCRRVLDWDFDRLVMSHGTTIEDEPQEKLEKALERWLLRHPAPVGV